MKKSRTNNKLQTLELKKEVVLNLSHDMLKDAVGGNKSTRPSQCPTLCF